MTIDVLGSKYSIEKMERCDDNYLQNCDGYCDKTLRKIVVIVKPECCELGDFDFYQRKVLRHEIIHAFLFESGLHENWEHSDGHDETYVDWIAAQYPKLKAAFIQAGCEE